ncbi:MAG: hypothetical protein HW384_1824 [Dehalococcoidia bacterium]|nr:hypothetical protein [Dehalococcoidia bacterium]
MTTVADRRAPQVVDGTKEAIERLKQGLAQGKHWFVALLEAMALWTLSEEKRGGRHYYYLVGGEAFDWLALSQRLLEEVEGQIPDQELTDFLFEGKMPLEMGPAELRELLGTEKYRLYMNFFYGVLIEDSLIMAEEDEVRKRWWCWGFLEPDWDMEDEVFPKLYIASKKQLWEKFCIEKGFRLQRQISLHQLNEFTYWLFKRRLGLWDKARIASDTRKGIGNWHRQRHRKVAAIDC